MTRGKAFSALFVLLLVLVCFVADSFALKKSWAHSEVSSLQSQKSSSLPKRKLIEEGFSKRNTLACIVPSPGPQFKCWNDQWTQFDTIISSGGAIPMTGGVLDMPGSLYMEAGSNLTVSSLTASLKVENCAVLSASVTLSLSAADLIDIREAEKTQVGAKFLLVDSSCNEASQMTVEIVSVPRECRIYSAKLVHEAGPNASRFATYVVYSWSSSRCHIWWIILVCILAITASLIGAMCLGKRLFCPPPKQARRRVAYSE
jgi:hypothetical protein